MRRTIAGLVFTTLVATGTASASSFVTPEPMTAKLGPSMIFLGAPASTTAAETPAKPAGTVAKALDAAPLDYPFPGGMAPPVVQTPERHAPDRIAGLPPLNYPAPVAPAVADDASETDFVRISPSIIAMAGPEPAVSFEQVAAVDKDGDESEGETARHDLFGPVPTVIRGGVVDDGSGAQFFAPAAPSKKPAGQNHTPAMARSGSAPSQAAPSPAASAPAKQPDVPIPSPTPAPPPANIVPETKIQ